MLNKKLNFDDIDGLPNEGESAVKALCGLARHLGYNNTFQSIYSNDGTSLTDLTMMLEDNPGLVDVMYEWIKENIAEKEDMDEEEEECDEVNCCQNCQRSLDHGSSPNPSLCGACFIHS